MSMYCLLTSNFLELFLKKTRLLHRSLYIKFNVLPLSYSDFKNLVGTGLGTIKPDMDASQKHVFRMLVVQGYELLLQGHVSSLCKSWVEKMW